MFLRGVYRLTATADIDSQLVFVERELVLDFRRQCTDMCMIVLNILWYGNLQATNPPPKLALLANSECAASA